MKLPECGEMFASRYRIERELGRGGFATVFLATNTLTGAQVALKVLTPGRGGDDELDMRRRFLREARVLERLEHPNIVQLLHAGEADGLLYLASEFVVGEDLSEVLKKRGRLDPVEAEHILVQLLQALGAAHRAGLIHRDVKPENVLVCPTPDDPLRVKLLDFGIARATNWGAPALTQTGEIVGTPRYMAPEQLTQRPASAASDVYALGIVGFELVLGRNALHGGAWGDQLERLRPGNVIAADHLHEVDPRLRDVLLRMTTVDVGDRFATTSAVEHALLGEAAEIRATAHRRARGFAVPVAVGVGLALALIIVGIRLKRPPEQTVSVVTSGRGLDLVRPRENEGAAAIQQTVLDLGRPDLAGCGDPDAVVDAMEFIEFRPPACDSQDCPLVLAFHDARPELVRRFLDPLKLTAAEYLERALSPLASEHGFILVLPKWTQGPAGAPWSGDFDYDRVDRFYEQYVDTRCVDRSRVFVVGYGAGVKAALRRNCRPWVTASAAFGRSYTGEGEEVGLSFCSSGPNRPFLWLHPRHSKRVPWTTKRPCPRSRKVMMGYTDVTTWLARAMGDHGRRRPANLDVPGISNCTRGDILMACAADGGALWPGIPEQPESVSDGCRLRVESDTDIGLAVWRFFESTPILTVPPSLEPDDDRVEVPALKEL